MSHGNLAEWILAALEASPSSVAFTFLGARGAERTLAARTMAGRIAGCAAAYRAAGIPARSVTPIIGVSSAELWVSFVAAIAADLIPCILPAPNFKTHLPTFVRNITTLMSRYESRTLVAGAAYRPVLEPILRQSRPPIAIVELESLQSGGSARPLQRCGDDDVAFLQHSSGSTGTPRGVALSHRAVIGHLACYARAIALDPARDRICSWLPLYHDMGLLTSFLFPLTHGVPCVTLPPQDWILAPLELLRLMTRDRSTLAWWPNFTYALMAQRARPGDLDGVDLGSLRMLVNCSEPVLASSHDAFARALGAAGLRERALHTCYAMAENVFAVTQSRSAGPLRLCAKRASLSAGRVIEPCAPDAPDARWVLSSGALIEGVSARVVDSGRRELCDGGVGEIAISGASLFSGYYRLPEESQRVREADWYYTGDVGFYWRGELFVLGRASDLIIVGGRKFYPNDIEHIVNEVPGVKEGRVVAFGVPREEKGTEEVVVLVESPRHGERGGVESIKREIKARVLQRLDCAVDRAVVLAPNSLIKTSSGKIARRDNRRWFLEELGGD